MLIAESQMMKDTEDIVNMNLEFLHLETHPNIVEANVLSMDWAEVIPWDELDYIMGNSPFVRGMMMTKNQTEELKNIMPDMPKIGELDYVAVWSYKASQYMQTNRKVKPAFVSTFSMEIFLLDLELVHS